MVKHIDFVGGQFIWTCFDYIGESTPYAYLARSTLQYYSEQQNIKDLYCEGEYTLSVYSFFRS